MTNTPNMPPALDPELSQALKEQEMKVEHSINVIRFAGVLFLYLLNLVAMVKFNVFTPAVFSASLLMIALFGSYSYFVHYFSRRGMYSPWLKYLTVTLDYLVLTTSFQKFKASAFREIITTTLGLTAPQIGHITQLASDIITSYLLIFILYNFLSALRNGRLIILYSTLLAVLGSLFITVQSDMVLFAQVYALFLMVLSGILTLTVSFTFNRLFIRFQSATQKVREYSQTLEVKVEERTEELNHKNRQLNDALKEVEQSNKKILDSIQYARRIQRSLLPSNEQLETVLPQNLVIWIPRDIVGGDIYFAEQFDSGSIVAVVDCTGHGIPGAFMTMLALAGIKKITSDEECLDPAEILKRLNRNLKLLLHQDSDQALSDDGLDAAICFIDKERESLAFAGARHSLIWMNGDRIEQIKGDRHSVGYKNSDMDFTFTNHYLKLNTDSTFYLLTDGLTDQLGGEKNFSFGSKRFCRLLQNTRQIPLDDQKKMILQEFNTYRGDREPLDDITVLGFSF